MGMACCGEEHEIKIVRTVNSGKRSIMVDNDEIHASSSRLDNKFECTWTMCGYRQAKFIMNRFPVGPKSRLFDFTLDGVSFFDFPKISQLGTSNHYDVTKSCPPNLTATKMNTLSTHVVNPRASRFSFLLPRRKKGYSTIPPTSSRPCPAIKTYKKKKEKDKKKLSLTTSDNNTCASSGTGYSSNEYSSMDAFDSNNSSPSSNMTDGIVERLTRHDYQTEFVEFNKLSGKYIISKTLPAHSAVC